ncbi:hypothetical protein CRG98_031940 [Punica granatum]|uniref:Uncharacterized protein n=1 Tax=Punica granatum TaxID=22663 RepID=A0A2I0IUI9_PUNGR|nr:hypothetical protein CRG98_031940 [Punica granatum]
MGEGADSGGYVGGYHFPIEVVGRSKIPIMWGDLMIANACSAKGTDVSNDPVISNNCMWAVKN